MPRTGCGPEPLEKIKLFRLFTIYREGTPWTGAEMPLCPQVTSNEGRE